MHNNNPAVNAFFGGSGGYESRLEHLNHVVRMEDVKSGQFPANFGVDFSQPLAHVTNDYLTIASGTKLQTRREEEERRIFAENQSLIRRLNKYDTPESRAKHHALLATPHDTDHYFSFQGSNAFVRQKEGDRINASNAILADRIMKVKSSVNNKRIAKDVARHDKLVKQISGFRHGRHVTCPASPRAVRAMAEDPNGSFSPMHYRTANANNNNNSGGDYYGSDDNNANDTMGNANGVGGGTLMGAVPPPLYKCSPRDAKACSVGGQRGEYASSAQGQQGGGVVLGGGGGNSYIAVAGSVTSRASPYAEQVLYTQRSLPFKDRDGVVDGDGAAENGTAAAGGGSSGFLPQIPQPPPSSAPTSPRYPTHSSSVGGDGSVRQKRGMVATILTPHATPPPEGGLAGGGSCGTSSSPKRTQPFVAFASGSAASDELNEALMSSSGRGGGGGGGDRGVSAHLEMGTVSSNNRRRQAHKAKEEGEGGGDGAMLMMKVPAPPSPRGGLSGSSAAKRGLVGEDGKLPWQSPSVDDLREHHRNTDAPLRRKMATREELTQRHRVVTNQAFYRRGEGSITLLGLYKSNSERMAALHAASGGGGGGGAGGGGGSGRRGLSPNSGPRNGFNPFAPSTGGRGGAGGAASSPSSASSSPQRPRSFSVLNAQHRLEAHGKTAPRKNHQSSTKRNVMRDAEEEFFYTSKSVYAAHNDTDPEPPDFTFNTHDYGDSHVCSKGCYRSHHKQLKEWRHTAKAVDARRQAQNEQFSIANQLEIQRLRKLEQQHMLTMGGGRGDYNNSNSNGFGYQQQQQQHPHNASYLGGSYAAANGGGTAGEPLQYNVPAQDQQQSLVYAPRPPASQQ